MSVKKSCYALMMVQGVRMNRRYNKKRNSITNSGMLQLVYSLYACLRIDNCDNAKSKKG
jgi:hypothetical protein